MEGYAENPDDDFALADAALQAALIGRPTNTSLSVTTSTPNAGGAGAVLPSISQQGSGRSYTEGCIVSASDAGTSRRCSEYTRDTRLNINVVVFGLTKSIPQAGIRSSK